MPYDLIIVLGSQPDLKTWEFPEQVNECLGRAKELLDSSQAPFIVTSGKWSTSIDTLGLHQPFLECDALADFLIESGVDERKIIRESKSQDTISNLYYLKTDLLMTQNFTKLLFVVADFRIHRLKFLCERIFGPKYLVDFEPIKSQPSQSYNEPQTFLMHKNFLADMKPGDHEWLADKFFDAPMYKQMAELDKQKYAYLK